MTAAYRVATRAVLGLGPTRASATVRFVDTTSESRLNEAMTPPLRATAIVGVGSVVTLGLSVVTAKAYAVLVGPEGVGLMALMLATINVAIVIASLGVSTSVIRWIAAAAADEPRSAIVQTAASLTGIAGGTVLVIVLIASGEVIADVILAAPERAGDVVLLAIAVGFGTIAGVQIGILNGRHRVGRATAVHIGTALVAATAGIGFVSSLGLAGIAPAFLATYAAQAALSRAFVGRTAVRRLGSRVTAAAVGLVREGAPIAASQLVSSAVLLIVPLLILGLLGTGQVGQFRAASTISTGYLSFFLAALTQDFLPRVANVRDADGAVELTDRRMRLVMGVAAPVILVLLAVGPWLVEWLYSAEFVHAFEMLKWLLVGDLIRLPAWVLAYVLIARARPLAYLAYELGAGAVVVATTYFGIAIGELEGAGAAYAVTQLVMYAVIWWIVRRRLHAAPGRLQAVVIVAALASAAVLVLISEPLTRLAVFAVTAVAFAAIAWPRLYQMHRTGTL